MLGIISMVVGEILFSFIVLRWKDLRKKGVSSLANLSILSFSVPFFVILWFVLDGNKNFNTSSTYFLFLLFWLIPVFAENFGSNYLIKYQGLLENHVYTLGFSTFIAIIADILFLKTNYNLYTWFAIILFLVSGYMLTKNRQQSKVHFGVSIVILLLLSVLGVLEYTTYKKAMLLQSNILLHTIVAQGILATAFFLYGYRPLLKGIKERIIKMKDIIYITLLFFPFVILESFGISQLPVAVVILTTIFPILIYSIYDAKNLEVKLSTQTISAFVVAIGGVIFMNM